MKKIEIKTLVVGLDFSSYSKLVWREAQKLSHELHVPLVGAHVAEMPYTGLSFSQFPTLELKKWYEDRLKKFYPDLKSHKIIVRFGPPHKKLIAIAKMFKKPMILVGHRGQGAFARFILGSVAERTSQLSPYPVWIHRGDKVTIPKSVLLPCDFKRRSSSMAEALQTFKKTFKSEFEFVHVSEEPAPVLDYELYGAMAEISRETEERHLSKFQKTHPKAKIACEKGDAPNVIATYSKRFDLVAIPRRSGKGRPFLGGFTSKMVRTGNKPVLVLP